MARGYTRCVSFWTTPDDYDWLERYADREHASMSALMRQALRDLRTARDDETVSATFDMDVLPFDFAQAVPLESD